MGQFFNEVRLSGRLTRNPDLRDMGTSGGVCCDFSLAQSRSFTNSSTGKRETVTEYFDCTAFGKTAEYMSNECMQGDTVLVRGRLKQDRWEDEQGNKRSKVKVLADGVKRTEQGARDDGMDQPGESREGAADKPLTAADFKPVG